MAHTTDASTAPATRNLAGAPEGQRLGPAIDPLCDLSVHVTDAPTCTLDLIMDAESSPDAPPPEVEADHDVALPVEDTGGDMDESAPLPSEARANRRIRAATVLMVPALLAFVGSAALFLVPVRNPGVQQCGAPGWFLLQAQSDRSLVTEGGTPLHGWSDARLRHAHADRCSAQVADRAVPAGILLVTFWILALVAIVLGWIGRRALRKKLAVDRQ